MPLTQPRRLSTVLAAGLGAVLSAGLLAQPAQAAGTPAQGTYQLNYSSVYAGQTVTLRQLSLTDNEDDRLLLRKVTWGDGSTGLIYDGEVTAQHEYADAGSYPVSVELMDLDGTTAGTITGTSTVTVAKVTGSYRLSAGTTWRGPSATLPVSLSLAGVPADATQVRIGWDDGQESTVARTTRSVSHRFAYSGAHRVTVSLVNGAGVSAPLSVGTVNVKLDYTSPTVKITTPAKSNRAASWKTIRGTAADKGAGASQVAIVVGQVRGGKTYYFNGKKWVRGSINKSKVRYATVKNGKWSVKIATPKKGYLIIGYAAVDKVGNSSVGKSKQVKLTR
ncbi:hypothetical protein GCM10010168_41940 [Actinoplanes ianthinogenes]|uniref:PKD domain-containing protein n=1 Tax=Actinoplanes ianthinogenes TaxID=122358 RepID=A0ABM7LVX6_9ACTN|nr:hypothetical protein [Actinoplanes ianthinogenes]BCJ43496.1 hypothetical protein Aiant_41530 [Actinoplanes ianthinogenes]GGR19714.1 hypothetical protein GCM10010168_41940 [Actinoplanes ianthinogenes]